MLLIYTEQNNSRIEYIFSFVLKEVLGLDYRIITSKEEFLKSEGNKISYALNSIGTIPNIGKSKFLMETGIQPINIEVHRLNDLPIIFKNPDDVESKMEFDVFAACFYMISRYEEYDANHLDILQRFDVKKSLAYQHKFLDKAVVDRWIAMFSTKLAELFPFLQFKKLQFSFTPTLDIDNAYAFKNKGIVRTLAATAKDVLLLKWSNALNRFLVLLKLRKDPYDSFEFIRKVHKSRGLKPIIFWLLGDYGMYDKNISPDNKNFQQLIASSSAYATLGIHPSFSSHANDSLGSECNRLSRIINRPIELSRMHYLKLSLPRSYDQLIGNGIIKDYTMGYSEFSGFRAGIARSFPFYNLPAEQATKLRVVPFQLMDATYLYHQSLTLEEVLKSMLKIVDEVKQVNGELYTVFHNECLGSKKEWKGWQALYVSLLDKITSEKGN